MGESSGIQHGLRNLPLNLVGKRPDDRVELAWLVSHLQSVVVLRFEICFDDASIASARWITYGGGWHRVCP